MDESIATIGNSSNLVGMPTGMLASSSFNDFPISLRIRSTREMRAPLLDFLNTAKAPIEARSIFQDCMNSRFGLFPTFDKLLIRCFNSWAWLASAEEKMSIRFDNNDMKERIHDSDSDITRLNNQVSLTSQRYIAEEFGDAVIDGDYRVKASCY